MRSHILPTLAVSALVVAATAAQAADLPSRRRAPVYLPPPIPVFTWTGFFVGGNAGATFGSSTRNSAFNFPAGSIANSSGSNGTLITNGARSSSIGFTGGGQIGYNYELGGAGFGGFGFGGGGLVLGAVADAQYRDNRRNDATSYNFIGAPGNAFVAVPGLPRTLLVNNSKSETFFGTVRGRLGVAFDRAMIYGTGGFAYNTRATGYTYGGGIEFSITNNVSVGAEYLHVNLNRGLAYNATYVPAASLGAGTLFLNTTGGRDEFNVARAFVNYRFTTPAAVPVVARY